MSFVKPNAPECDLLEVLTTLVEAYEQRHYPIEAPDLIEAILYYLESRGLSWQETHIFLPQNWGLGGKIILVISNANDSAFT